LVLHPSDSGALRVTGGGTLAIPGGTIGVNSTSASAVNLTGGATLSCSNLNVVGSYSGTVIANFVHTGVGTMLDPFQYLTLPQITGANLVLYGDGATANTSPDSGGTAAAPANKRPSGTATLRPGIYWGGIKITGGTITFQPGRYVLAGGGFEISGSPTITGTNCVFYNTRDPYSGSGAGSYGQISVAGSSAISLKAVTRESDSTYGGFLFINDRANSEDVNLSGGASSASSGPLSGFIYGAASELKVTGGGYMGGIGAIVRKMTVSGNSQFTALDISRVPGVTSAGLME
jgi:hypothetical protein